MTIFSGKIKRFWWAPSWCFPWQQWTRSWNNRERRLLARCCHLSIATSYLLSATYILHICNLLHTFVIFSIFFFSIHLPRICSLLPPAYLHVLKLAIVTTRIRLSRGGSKYYESKPLLFPGKDPWHDCSDCTECILFVAPAIPWSFREQNDYHKRADIWSRQWSKATTKLSGFKALEQAEQYENISNGFQQIQVRIRWNDLTSQHIVRRDLELILRYFVLKSRFLWIFFVRALFQYFTT